jgi:hypothetical protein
MSTFASAFKREVIRLSRREIKAMVETGKTVAG